MHVVDTVKLVAEGVLTPAQGALIAERSRSAMVALAVNTVLCFGIAAAGAGFIVLLGSPGAVAVTGAAFLGLGIAILLRGGGMVRMFGTAAALIGAVMLTGGATLQIMASLSVGQAAITLTGLGAVLAAGSGLTLWQGPERTGFIAGTVLLIGLGLHLYGLDAWLTEAGVTGPALALASLYAATLLALAGWLTDVRLVTALAIVPFAQMLDTGSSYFHATYVFFSPEPTLSILQMGALVALCLWGMARGGARTARHLGILAIMGFIIGNLCFLTASIFGDVVGGSWVPGADWSDPDMTYEAREAMETAFRAHALVIPAGVFAVVWAALLALGAWWAAKNGQRGLFNASVTFGAIHAYTQVFESFADQPLAWIAGGLTAIPLAWGMWRLDAQFRPDGAA